MCSRGKRGCSVWMRCTELLETEPLCLRPDQLASPGIELHVVHKFPEGIGDFDGALFLGRVHPVEQPVDEGIVLEGVLLTPCAHRRSIPLAG